MKSIKTVLILLIAVIFVSVGVASADQNRYQIKSGQVKYQYKGSGGMGIQSGEENVIWDNFGANEVRESNFNFEVMGSKHQNKSTTIIDQDWAYSYDAATNQITKIKLSELMNLKGKDAGKMLNEKNIEDYGGEKIGEKTVLNHKCNNYRMADYGTEACIHKGVPLLTVMNYMGITSTIEAVEFKENIKVAKGAFDLPQGVDVVDATDMVKQYQQYQQANPEDMKKAMGAFEEMQKAYKESGNYQDTQKMNQNQPQTIPPSMNKQAGEKIQKNLTDQNTQGDNDPVTSALSIFGKRSK